jgi:hypothetical protein
MKKFAVMTSIFTPTKAVEKLAGMKNWQLVMVGDKKTPENWQYDNVCYISPSDQMEMSSALVNKLPWNHYSRKMIGYLFAMQHGADIIADVDDDNIPIDNWGELPFPGPHDVINQPDFVNIYQFFSDSFIWPRGFPLDKVRNRASLSQQNHSLDVGIWQFLANGNPDVDAIHRLLFNQTIEFSDHKPIVLDKDVYCPFNSQNTIFLKNSFPLLYLPATVSFRFTDILRGIVAQPVLWAHNLRLGFGSATMYQERNPHNYMEDFESEIPMYLYSEKAAYLAGESVAQENTMSNNLLSVYMKLAEHEIVSRQELDILMSWIQDIETL